MFKLLTSKKGFSLVEIFTVVIILAILAAVAVPLFGAGIKKQKQNECSNQRIIISTAVEQVMYGMVDNGKKQVTVKDSSGNVIRYALDFSKVTTANTKTYPAVAVKDEKGVGVNDNAYVGKTCLVLTYPKSVVDASTQSLPYISGLESFTIGDIRGGYRADGVEDYKDGCDNGNYLKKKAMANTAFYTILDNQEIPVCPFADYDNEPTEDDYYYHILWDTDKDCLVVLCSCPHCNEAD